MGNFSIMGVRNKIARDYDQKPVSNVEFREALVFLVKSYHQRRTYSAEHLLCSWAQGTDISEQ